MKNWSILLIVLGLLAMSATQPGGPAKLKKKKLYDGITALIVRRYHSVDAKGFYSNV
jgi:hypothetical protein